MSVTLLQKSRTNNHAFSVETNIKRATHFQQNGKGPILPISEFVQNPANDDYDDYIVENEKMPEPLLMPVIDFGQKAAPASDSEHLLAPTMIFVENPANENTPEPLIMPSMF